MPPRSVSQKAKVLLTEDEVHVQRFVTHALQRAGHAVLVADTGPEGLRALDREPFDVVLLDVNLPGIGGLEILAAGRVAQPDARFVVITGAATIDMAVEAMKLGARDFLSKPLGVEELVRAVDGVLRPDDPEGGVAGVPVTPLDALPRRRAEIERELIARAAQDCWSLDRVEREYILEVLRHTNGHQIQAAEILGVDRRTLYRKLRRYRDKGGRAEPDFFSSP